MTASSPAASRRSTSSSTAITRARRPASTRSASSRREKGDRARDIAFYEAGSAYDPAFEATSDDGEIFLGWYTEDGTLLTDLLATQDLTVTARWQSDDAWV